MSVGIPSILTVFLNGWSMNSRTMESLNVLSVETRKLMKPFYQLKWRSTKWWRVSTTKKSGSAITTIAMAVSLNKYNKIVLFTSVLLVKTSLYVRCALISGNTINTRLFASQPTRKNGNNVKIEKLKRS